MEQESNLLVILVYEFSHNHQSVICRRWPCYLTWPTMEGFNWPLMSTWCSVGRPISQ